MEDILFVLPKEEKERDIARFSVSELYFLFKGWTSLEDYVKGKKFTPKDLWTMALGTAKHELIQSCFTDKYEMEVKKEYPVGDVTIVGKADMINKEHGIEIKTSEKLYPKAKDWHLFQARMYCSMFELPIFYIVQPVIRKDTTLLKVIGSVKKNDKWFKEQVKKVEEIHSKIKSINK